MTAATAGVVDVYRLHDITWRIIDAGLADRVTVQVGTADPDEPVCEQCPPLAADPADVTVWWGYTRPVYATAVCETCLPRLLKTRLGHDRARPVVVIPAS